MPFSYRFRAVGIGGGGGVGGVGGGECYTFPMSSVRAGISAKRTL